jgi:hypothetical protein
MCWDAALAAALTRKARDPRLKPTCMRSLLETLLAREDLEARAFVESLVNLPIPAEGVARRRAIAAATILLVRGGSDGWSRVWRVILDDSAFGREVLMDVAGRHDQQRAALLTLRLTEDQTADLYVWLVRQFPPADDPEHEGMHWVGPRDAVAHFRDAVLKQLQGRETALACRELDRVARELPELPWLRWAVVQAREGTLRRTWLPVRPDVLLRMGRDRALRLVDNEEQLLEVVLDSLRRLEQELQGENPAAPDLWNQLKDGRCYPKDETALSDYIARHLRRDVQAGGIVANREVEIRRGEGGASGERTDIHVDATASGRRPEEYQTLRVVVEIKGCWNRGLMKDMEDQLRNRYLHESQCRHGLYLVGWFVCPQWDKGDERKKRTPKRSLAEAQRMFDEQAGRLSTDGVRIRALVLNAALR